MSAPPRSCRWRRTPTSACSFDTYAPTRARCNDYQSPTRERHETKKAYRPLPRACRRGPRLRGRARDRRLFRERLRNEVDRHGWRRHRRRTGTVRWGSQSGRDVVPRERMAIGRRLVQPASQRFTQRRRGVRPRCFSRQRQQQLLHPRVRDQLEIQPRPRAWRNGIWQRRDEHRLSGRTIVKGHSIGVTPVIAYQRFKAEGLQAFDNPQLSNSPGNVTNNGYDDSWGVGARIGYMGQLTDWLAIGGAWQSKISMGSFDKYQGLFAQQGGFDIPSTFTLGFALRPTNQWLIAVDFQRIYYSDAPSINNPSALLGNCVFAGQRTNCLGGDNGAERRLDAARRLQPFGQPDPVAGRHFQHPRARRSPEPVLSRRNLADRQGLRNHRCIHVRGQQFGDGTEPHWRLPAAAGAADHGNDPDEGIPGRDRLQPQVLTPVRRLIPRASSGFFDRRTALRAPISLIDRNRYPNASHHRRACRLLQAPARFATGQKVSRTCSLVTWSRSATTPSSRSIST